MTTLGVYSVILLLTLAGGFLVGSQPDWWRVLGVVLVYFGGVLAGLSCFGIKRR